MFLFSHTPEKSINVLEETKEYISNRGFEEKILTISRIYRSVGDLTPHSLESFWSGHFFPWIECSEEVEISYNLCAFGFYKQAMVSLRSALELGMLSVYWNLNNDGHNVIQKWVKSKENTPRNDVIWKKLSTHNNFLIYDKIHDLKSQILQLGYLHNYVHTKGFKFSNKFGLLKSNFQTFEAKAFEQWWEALQDVTRVIAICHLIKYPLGTVRESWDDKFGFDKPMAGIIDIHEVDLLEKFLGIEIFNTLEQIAKQDKETNDFLCYYHNLPDITEEQYQEQIEHWDKFMIQSGGLENWLKLEHETINYAADKEKKLMQIEQLSTWAKENGFDKPPNLR